MKFKKFKLTAQRLCIWHLKHRQRKSMVVDRPKDKRPMVQHIRTKIRYSIRFVVPNPSNTICCPISNLNFVMCHCLLVIYHALPIELIAVQGINEMLIYALAP